MCDDNNVECENNKDDSMEQHKDEEEDDGWLIEIGLIEMTYWQQEH